MGYQGVEDVSRKLLQNASSLMAFSFFDHAFFLQQEKHHNKPPTLNKVADLSPIHPYTCSETKPQMVPSWMQILVKPGFGGLIQGQIYNPA